MEIISVIGVLLTLLGLFVPSLISSYSSRNVEFRNLSAPLLGKLLCEMDAIAGGSYQFRLISDADFNQILPYAPRYRRKALRRAYASYLDAHSIAITKHWHDAPPSDGTIFFPASLILVNSTEVMEKMVPLKKELSR